MKKEIIKPAIIFALLEIFLFSVFVLQNSAFALCLFFFFLFFSAATYLTAFLSKDKISAKAVLPPTGEKNKELSGKIVFENRSRFPVFKAICEVSVKNRLTEEENRINIILSAPPKGKTEGEFCLSSEFCGYITAKAERVFLTDIFGILPVAAKDFSSAKGKTTVLPETFEPVIVFDGILPVPEDSESYSPDKKGYDYSETFQIREYSPGDSIRQIHWKLSEKLDKTIVRDPSLPIAKNIMLFWDKTAGTANPKETDSMAEVSSSVAQSLLKSGYEFMLGWSEGNRTETAEIKTEEELLEAIPRMIKSSGEKAEEGFENAFERFGKIIVVAKEPPGNLIEKPGINLLVCNKSAAGKNVVPFGAETYSEDLEFLELCL